MKSRKLWLAIVAAAVTFINYKFDMGLRPEEVFQIVAPLLVYIGVEGTADVVERFNKTK